VAGFSDYLTTVSRKYAKKSRRRVWTRARRVVRRRADYLTGILNGVDYAAWNPERDKLIAESIDKRYVGKLTCKKNLLEVSTCPGTVSRPLIGIVSRFADQKDST